MIPYGKQDITQKDIDAVIEVLKSEFLTQGPKVPLFEQKVANYVKAKFSLAFNSATSALHASCIALGVSEGDIVWTSPNSFVASSNCALYCNAKVDFIDIDPETGNICSQRLEEMLIEAKKENQLPKVIIPVHFAGQSCDMEAIHQLSKQFNFKIIEDASHAIGGEFNDSKIGSCQFSDITIFSFHPVKIITTAEGGVATTNDSLLANTLMHVRSHGIVKDPDGVLEKNAGLWYYEQHSLGFNYRMTELQAALGISQLDRLDDYINKRNIKAEYYNKQLSTLPLTPLKIKYGKSAYHLYVIKLNNNESHKKIFKALRAKGIGVNLHYIPISNHPFYKEIGYSFSAHPNAYDYYSRAISLPLYPALSQNDQDYIVQTLKKLLK